MPAHDAPEYAAVRAFSDLPVLPGDPYLPARATPRAEMLQQGAETVRDRQRATLDNYLRGVLQAMTPGDSLTRHYLTGAALAAQAMDVLTMAEASAWIERAWEASRG